MVIECSISIWVGSDEVAKPAMEAFFQLLLDFVYFVRSLAGGLVFVFV